MSTNFFTCNLEGCLPCEDKALSQGPVDDQVLTGTYGEHFDKFIQYIHSLLSFYLPVWFIFSTLITL